MREKTATVDAGTEPEATPGRLFVFGAGYAGGALARALAARGWRVAATVREPEAAGAAGGLRGAGVAVHPFDGEALGPDARAALEAASHILSSVPPDDQGDPVLRWHGEDLAARAAGTDGGPPPVAPVWVGYLSTTGVYGDREGGTVDETTERRPTSDRARRRAAAEDAWLALGRPGPGREPAPGLAVHLFRLAGIYGPGRSVLDQLRAGHARRIVRPGQVFSRIHVADIVAVLRASMARPRPGAIYNVCDDLPAAPAEVVSFGAGLLGIDPPPEEPFAEAVLSDMARTFWADNKRVDNRLIHEELGVRLDCPDYRAGLRAILAAGG